MSSDLTLSLKLLLNNRNLLQGLQKSSSNIKNFTTQTRNEINALRTSFNSLAGRIAQIGVSISAVQQIIKSAKLDQSIIRIGQTADATKAQIANLRAELFRMAKENGNDIEDLKLGFDDLIASGQNWDQALASIKSIDQAMVTTGADSKSLASALTVASTAFDFDLSKAGAATKFLDEMIVAGKEGNAELESLADIISRIGTNAASAGMSRQRTLAFVETLSLVEKSPERLATLADSTLRLFNNQNYAKSAQRKTGVNFFNKDGTRREVMTVMTDMKFEYDKLKTEKDKNNFLFSAFGKTDLDTQKGIKTLFTGDMIQKSNQIFEKINNAGGTLAKDLPSALDNAVSQTGRLKAALREAADDFAKPINQVISNTIKWGMDKKENGGLELSGKEMIGGGIAATLATIVAARYGGKAIQGIAGKLSGIGQGVATGKALESMAGVTPVYVVNMPDAGISSLPGNTKSGRVAKQGANKLLKYAKAGGKGLLAAGAGFLGNSAALTVSGIGAAGFLGYSAGTALNREFIDGTKLGDQIGESVARVLATFGYQEAKQALEANFYLDSEKIATRVEKRWIGRGNRK